MYVLNWSFAQYSQCFSTDVIYNIFFYKFPAEPINVTVMILKCFSAPHFIVHTVVILIFVDFMGTSETRI